MGEPIKFADFNFKLKKKEKTKKKQKLMAMVAYRLQQTTREIDSRLQAHFMC